MKHFGVNLRAEPFEMSRDAYAIIDNRCSLSFCPSNAKRLGDGSVVYPDEWCREHKKRCLINYDINMKYFQSLNHDAFEKALQRFLKTNKKFIEVHDLNEYKDEPGYYILMLDRYCQVYIGTTVNSIKSRILHHWSEKQPFDRLLFGGILETYVQQSKISIDSFRALDTTRIFAYKTNRTYLSEEKYISRFSPQYVTNRLAGGIQGPTLNPNELMITMERMKR